MDGEADLERREPAWIFEEGYKGDSPAEYMFHMAQRTLVTSSPVFRSSIGVAIASLIVYLIEHTKAKAQDHYARSIRRLRGEKWRR